MAGPRKQRKQDLDELVVRNGGYFTAAQARGIGYTHQAQAHNVRAGNWERVDRGIFRLASALSPSGEFSHFSRWARWSNDLGVISHESALAVHGLGELESSRVEMTVPPGFKKEADAVHLHYGHLDAGDVELNSGFRLTTPTKSIIDVAGKPIDEDQLARLIEDATDQGMISLRNLRSESERQNPLAALYIERAMSAKVA